MEREESRQSEHLADVACIDSQFVVSEIKRYKIRLLGPIEDGAGMVVIAARPLRGIRLAMLDQEPKFARARDAGNGTPPTALGRLEPIT